VAKAAFRGLHSIEKNRASGSPASASADAMIVVVPFPSKVPVSASRRGRKVRKTSRTLRVISELVLTWTSHWPRS